MRPGASWSDLADSLHVDEQAGRIYVARQEPAHTTEYVLPLTGERRAALQAYAQAYGRTAAAYATIGANQAATPRLPAPISPRTACTGCCVSSRSATLPTPPF